MPILGAYPVLTQPADLFDPFADTRTLAFRSLDGATLLPFTGDEFIALDGIQGLGKVPRTVVESSTPGMDGTRIDDILIGSKKVFLPLFVRSNSSHRVFLGNMDRLDRLFNHRGVDYRATDGTLDLVAESLQGQRSLRCLYVDGDDGDFTQDSYGASWASMGLNLLAVRPYWTGTPWTTQTVFRPTAVSWFGTFPPSLTSSRALGTDMPVTVGGGVPSWPSADLVGPASSVLIQAPGLNISLPGGLTGGEQATIVTNPRGRTVKFNGVKDWSRVAPLGRRFWPLAPGNQSITVQLAGATAATSARIYGDTNWESPW